MAIKVIKNFKKIKPDRLPLVIGYFGCIHVMHQQLLTKYHDFNVLTFTDLMNKSEHKIYNYQSRLENLEKFEPKNIYVLDVSSTNMTAEKFIKNVLNRLDPSEILVGEDFKFGSDNWTVKELKNYFKVNALRHNDNISTKKIYDLIVAGKIEEANDYLSFYLYYKNKWILGLRKARTLGYPTINLKNERPFNLPQGSYVSLTTIGNKQYKSVTFVGESKVFHHRDSLVETHIINRKLKPRYLYPIWVRNNIKVEFLKFIRPAEKFKTAQILKDNIKNDIEVANKFFREQNI